MMGDSITYRVLSPKSFIPPKAAFENCATRRSVSSDSPVRSVPLLVHHPAHYETTAQTVLCFRTCADTKRSPLVSCTFDNLYSRRVFETFPEHHSRCSTSVLTFSTSWRTPTVRSIKAISSLPSMPKSSSTPSCAKPEMAQAPRPRASATR